MRPALWEGTPQRPPSIAEWEDLLVRLDIAPRALRVAVDDAGEGNAEVLRVLQVTVAREGWFGTLVEALREGREVSLDFAVAPVGLERAREEVRAAEARELCWAFESLRARTFAQVQRRGVGVWEWESAVAGGGGVVSVYQALVALSRADGETLAMIRAAGRGEEVA